MCQTAVRQISQRQAAIEAVKKIGLNQIGEVDQSWFYDEKTANMFFTRLNILRNIEAES